MAKTVLVVGATGMLGSKICRALRDRGANVPAMFRATGNRTKLQPLGVSDFVIGDMMARASLSSAFAQRPDAIIAGAAGYTRHTKGDSPKTDRQGYRNLVDASKA